MKIFDENRTLLTNSKNKSKLKIQANGKMFSILSDKIYKHKIAAIVREISSNCYDSHVEAGIADKPFQVVLPTDMHPYIEFQDFGVGLSYDQVVNIFTVYGASTKNDSNDAIGAFGLGAKTPFAYSKTFSVETVKDGISLYFNMFIDEDNEPSYSLVHKKETDKPNGTTIKIPVSSKEDQDQFKWECEYILSFYPVRPTIIKPDYLNFNFVVSEENIEELNKKGFMVVNISDSRSDLYNSGYSAYAVMGPVCYPFNFSDANIDSWKVKEQFPILHSLLDRNTLFIKFNIGDLDVSASRESLSLDKPSVRDILLSKLLHGNTESLKNIQDNINSCNTPKELFTLFEKLHLRDFEIYKKLTYKGKKVSSIINRNFFKGFKRKLVRLKHTKHHVIDSYGDYFKAKEMTNSNLVFLYNYGKHKTSFKNLVDYATNAVFSLPDRSKLVLLRSEPSESRQETLKSILPCDAKFINLLDLEDERTEWVKNNTTNTNSLFVSVNELSKREFKARSIVVNTDYMTTKRYDKSKVFEVGPNTEDIVYLYIDKDDVKECGILIHTNGQTFQISTSNLHSLFKITEPEKKIIICIRTKQNKKRMTHAGVVDSMSDYVEQNWVNNKEIGDAVLLNYIITKCVDSNYETYSLFKLNYSTSWYLDKLINYKNIGIKDIPKIDYEKDIMNIIGEIGQIDVVDNTVSRYEFTNIQENYRIFTFYSNELITKFMSTFKHSKCFNVIHKINSLTNDVVQKYIDEIETKYPMLSLIDKSDLNNIQNVKDKNKIKVYIDLIDGL